MSETKTLHLTLHRKWFDAIANGEKTEEYREVKRYWSKRIMGREYDEIFFRNGYHPDSPTMRVEYLGYVYKDYDGIFCFALQLGKILEVKNHE
jgi:hypothetical protein